ncbi:gas vesicle protein GvpG [Paraburkholderia sp. A1RI_3L]|uniref:gas vesicle protein GvpG n=1 Tax=Paraburkholderia TaxID=1822464 RepID=UPI003B785558
MLLVENILASPFKGLMWVFEQVADAVRESQDAEVETLKAALADLYRDLESGAIGEREFDLQEQRLLDRLDELAEDQP